MHFCTPMTLKVQIHGPRPDEYTRASIILIPKIYIPLINL